MINQAEVNAYRTAYLAKARETGLDQRGAMPPTRDQFSECIAAGLAAAWTARTDNVKRDNMSDQPNDDDRAALKPPTGFMWRDGELTRKFSEGGITFSDHVHAVPGEDPVTADYRDMINANRQVAGIDGPASVRTGVIADGVDSDLDLQVKILDHGISDDAIVNLSFPADTSSGSFNVPVSKLRQVLAVVDGRVAEVGRHDYTEPAASAVVYDRGGKLELRWKDRAGYVTVTPEVLEGFVEQVNTLRAELAARTSEITGLSATLAEAVEERDRLRAWSDELAHLVPETYEGGEGTQEACINAWIIDLMKVADPFAAELRADVDGLNHGDLTVPIPADPREQEHLYDAAHRLAGGS